MVDIVRRKRDITLKMARRVVNRAIHKINKSVAIEYIGRVNDTAYIFNAGGVTIKVWDKWITLNCAYGYRDIVVCYKVCYAPDTTTATTRYYAQDDISYSIDPYYL